MEETKINEPTQRFIVIAKKALENEDFESVQSLADALGYNYGNLSSVLNRNRNLPEKYLQKASKIFKNENMLKVRSGTPIYDIHASASQVEYTGQLPEVPAFWINIPGYEDCNFGMFHYGHSMYPTIETGSMLMCKQVKDKSVIMYGEIYLIRTGDYLMVKRLQKNSQKGYVMCTSDNFEKRSDEFKRYEPFDMAIDKIIDLYLVKGIIKKTQS